MVGTEHQMLALAVTECALSGKDWMISDSSENVVWSIERDTKVDNDDLSWPVIVHLRGAMSSDAVAVLTEVVTPREP